MSENSGEQAGDQPSDQSESTGTGIGDEDLPEDLQPTDDNPLAQELDEEDAHSREELDVLGGKLPEQSDDGSHDGSHDGSPDDTSDDSAG
ncbi:hypothetical protein [Nocardioides sp.]|uniref:hypothetical protein n=1 Tax=Nocardioides sp. TaxID=35761 RepID=UPI00378348DA